MLNFFDPEDVFFDSVSQLGDGNLTPIVSFGYDLWRNELMSVKERRDSFLQEMGFVEEGSSSVEIDNVGLLESVPSSCDDSSVEFCKRECGVSDDDSSAEELLSPSTSYGEEKHRVVRSVSKRLGHWWKEVMSRCEVKRVKPEKVGICRMKTRVRKKGFKELSALFESHEIQAHEGVIRAMKFSNDGKYLASGGQDGVVKVWCIELMDSSLEQFPVGFGFKGEKNAKPRVVIPEKMFKIEEKPLHEFHGHSGEVLDLAWSNANCLLSASTDKTVRLWQIGSEQCLNVFNHTDYVSCVQFNPVDEHSFISGSIDGKVRVWGLSKGRVLDWADIGDAVTAVSYQLDGQGFVVGSLGGICRFYDAKGDLLELTSHMLIHSNRKSSNNRITGIQFSPEDSQTVMVMCEDSKLRVFNKMEVTRKYKGLPKSGSQMSASFTSNQRHIISIGEDSRVYVWNHKDPRVPSSPKRKASILSCEHFRVEGVTVALPWSSTENVLTSEAHHPRNSSLVNFLPSRHMKTWPEEMLSDFNPFQEDGERCHEPPCLGLVIVMGNCDGVIRTFHNYGFPVNV